MNGCEQLHRLLEAKPLIRYPYAPGSLPDNAVYFMYEDGQTWGHGGDQPRIVQVGTHKDGNLAPRLAEQFLLRERKMDFGLQDAAPKDRSILRKSIGRAFLNKAGDQYLPVWNLDLTGRAARDRFASSRDIEKEKEVESAVTEYMRSRFSFRVVEIPAESTRLGEGSITRRIIATVAQCDRCSPTSDWLGNHSPNERICQFGLWQVQHTRGGVLEAGDFEFLSSCLGIGI
jgi:hypothetical protein